ncbi:ABC transporter substrate-binding protein [Acidisphaera sp. L21]|uniref:ABC transporter substrate-binding protein n=1 Tax=Acidisphaera sp. L21 TaxID=1641851 RepID=UPI00131D795A|nr:ABC transporter substrate-binding protein [Acidisphaera sp. L21]
MFALRVLAAAGALALGIATARAEAVVTVAMTAGDIPITNGIPDQGSEGIRFVGYSLYDALVGWDLSHSDKPADIVPGLATKWEIDPANPKRWVFTIREGVKFHDGCGFDPDAVVWNFDRLTNPKIPQFDPLQFALARTSLTNLEKYSKLDDHHVAFDMKIKDSLFPYEIATMFMVSPCRVKETNYSPAAYAANPAGTGPYKFDKIVPHERLELVANKDYWNKARIPKHDRLVLLPMAEPGTRVAALLSGQVNFAEAPPPDAIPRLKSAGMNVITLIYPHNWGYQLDFTKKPFNDIRIRRAANYAINRADMVDLMGGTAIAGYSTAPPGHPFYGNPIKYEYDPAMATKLLKEAGCYPCAINFAISSSGSGQMQPLPMNELVKSNLDAVGFKTTITVMDWNALLDVSRQGPEKFPQYAGINVSRSLPDAFMGLIRHVWTPQWSPVGGNWGHYSNPKMDTLIEQVLGEFDDAKRATLIKQLHDYMNEEAVMIWVAHDLNPRALSPKLHGFVQAQSWYQDLTPITVSP